MNYQKNTLAIVDDHQLFRDGLSLLLKEHLNFARIINFDSGVKVTEQLFEHMPDIIIMDIGLPNLNGIEATKHIKKKSRHIKIIGLSMYADPHKICQMLDAGADGYIAKDSDIKEVITAIETVLSGSTYLSPQLIGPVLGNLRIFNLKKKRREYKQLTLREREVLRYIAEGKSTTDISHSLDINIKTVEAHRKNIMQKLDIHTIAGLTKYALKEGFSFIDS